MSVPERSAAWWRGGALLALAWAVVVVVSWPAVTAFVAHDDVDEAKALEAKRAAEEAMKDKAAAIDYAQAQAEGRLMDARPDGWKTTLDKVRSVQWTPATAKLVFQHRRVRDGEIYFVVNYGDAFSGQVSFPHAGQRPETWNPDTGEATPVARYTDQNGGIHIPVTLAHFESASFVFSKLPALVHVTEGTVARSTSTARAVSTANSTSLANPASSFPTVRERRQVPERQNHRAESRVRVPEEPAPRRPPLLPGYPGWA